MASDAQRLADDFRRECAQALEADNGRPPDALLRRLFEALSRKELTDDAYETLDKLCGRRLRRFLRRISRCDDNDVDDLTQQVLIEVLKQARLGPQPEGRQFYSWLLGIAVNTKRRFFTEMKHRPLSLSELSRRDDEGDSAVIEVADPVDYEAKLQMGLDLERFRAELPDRQREVCTLFLEGFKYEEIAKILNTNQKTVGSNLHKVRNKARKTLGPHVPMPRLFSARP